MVVESEFHETFMAVPDFTARHLIVPTKGRTYSWDRNLGVVD